VATPWYQLGACIQKKSPPLPTPIISPPSSEIRTQRNDHSPGKKKTNKTNTPSLLRILLLLLHIKTLE
jgi:hypothetical protein